MKEFYIFNIKSEFARLYKDKPSQLFFIFNRIYNMKSIDKKYGYNLFEQVSMFFDKDNINLFIRDSYIDDLMYSNTKNEHIINNLYLGEVSILTVKSSHLKIESNNDHPSFINILKKYNPHLFVCNFKEQDFYFLKHYRERINI